MSQLVRKIRHPSSPLPCLPSVLSLSTPDPQIETLYFLPDARIVEFKPPGLCSRPGTRNDANLIEFEPGSLSWASRFERTVAVEKLINHAGSLRVYRALGSIAFLNCQDTIRPILPKSQVWCVDGESKFVLRSPTLFWRIEVPNMTREQAIRVQELKNVFDEILLYEKTPCPFRRISINRSPTSLVTVDEKSQISPSKPRPVNEIVSNNSNISIDYVPQVESLNENDENLKSYADLKITTNYKSELSTEVGYIKVESYTTISSHLYSLNQSYGKRLWAYHRAELAQKLVEERSNRFFNLIFSTKNSEDYFSKFTFPRIPENESHVVKHAIQSSIEISNTPQLTPEAWQPFQIAVMLDSKKRFTPKYPNSSSINTILILNSGVSTYDLFHNLQLWQAPLVSLISSPRYIENPEILSCSSSFDSSFTSFLKTPNLLDLESDIRLESSKAWNNYGLKMREDEKISILKQISTMPGFYSREYSNEDECDLQALAFSDVARQQSRTAIDAKHLSIINRNSAPVVNRTMHKIAYHTLSAIIEKTILLLVPSAKISDVHFPVAARLSRGLLKISIGRIPELKTVTIINVLNGSVIQL